MLGRGVRCLAVLLLVSPPLAAQTLRDRIDELFTFGSCGQPLCLDPSILADPRHGNHFIASKGTTNGLVLDFIGNAVSVYTSTLPLSSTSSGVTFKFVGGLPVKTSQSMGPIFTERGQTLGHNRFLMGMYVTGAQFKTLRGLPIDNMSFNFTHENETPAETGGPPQDSLLGSPLFENDVINVRMSLYVSQVITSFFVTYGLLDNVDISVAVPLVHSSMEGRSVGQILPFGPPPVLHYWGGTATDPILRASAATFGSATGIGDVAGRLKINFHNAEHLAVAALADARFATGDPANFLGAGEFSIRGLAIFSSRFGGFSPHLNAGYVYRQGDVFNDGVIANGGFDQFLAPWATLAADVLSEWQVGKSKLQLPAPVQYQFPYARTVEQTQVPDQADNRVTASLGFKFRLGSASTLVTNVLVPILKGGMSPPVAWTGGAEFNF